MASVQVHDDTVELDAPYLVEGLPGVGLVGKIAADHLVDALDMEHYASVHCEGLPKVAVYHEGDRASNAAVRVYAAPEHDLLVLQSDVPVSAEAASDFAACLTGWFAEVDAVPILLTGRPAEKEGVPKLSGVGSGAGSDVLEDGSVAVPAESGVVAGPTGALLNAATREGMDAACLVVESDPQFPDPEAARVVLESGIEPITGVDVAVSALVEHAEEIREQKQRLAERMQQAGSDESSQVKPLGMYQ
jgi:uncharacterized protein